MSGDTKLRVAPGAVRDDGGGRGARPLDVEFYRDLQRRREEFTLADSHVVPAGTGYGLRLTAGQVLRLAVVGQAQVTDLCLWNADDATEHYSTGAQLAIEGGRIGRMTRVWGTAPRSRPLATCIADTVRLRPSPDLLQDHFAFGAYCTPHMWCLYTGQQDEVACYDKLRDGMAMVGLEPRQMCDSLNLFMKGALVGEAGDLVVSRSDAEDGDYIEFYAELPLFVAMSLCAVGAGPDVTQADEFWDAQGASVPTHPLGVEVFDTNTQPRAWPGARRNGR